MTTTPTPASQPSPALDRTDYSTRVVQTNTATIPGMVYVCPERDIECGRNPKSWCATCPQQPSPARSDLMGQDIEAAERQAALYDGDDRECIKTDVINSFYAGIAYERKRTAPARSDKDADHVKPWQERVDPAYSVYKKFTAAQQEIAELRALLAVQSTRAGEAQAERPAHLTDENNGTGCVVLGSAELAPSGEAPARTFGDLAALLPGEFMWGDALQAATLCEILGAYDAQRATADNAAPTEADCHPTCGYIGADCNYPACKLSFASNAATAAPGDLPPLPKPIVATRHGTPCYTVGQMMDYGRECLASSAGTAPGMPLAHGHRDDFYLMANGRRIAQHPISMIRTMPNWALASELFATGSNSARQICQDAGIDPDACTIGRAPSNPPVGAKEQAK